MSFKNELLSPDYISDHRGKAANTTFKPSGGLTKREYFAGLALQGLLAGRNAIYSDYHKGFFCSQAVKEADLLLKELKK